MTDLEEANADYQLLGLSTRYHAMAFYRPQLDRLGAATADALAETAHGCRVRVGGLVICRQAPPTAKGHVFLTLEDETGLANVIVRPGVYQRYREIVRGQPVVLVEGVLQRQDGALSIMARRFAALSHAEVAARVPSRDFR